ncbi:MAG: ABC transporter substrate-binding protein [Chloroflexi bacterium]|nr:ABC transporter substrate-binding protein [Chloroflexota bacterium]
MLTKRFLIIASCLTVLAPIACAPPTQPTPVAKSAAPSTASATSVATSAPKLATATAAATGKPSGPTPTVKPAAESRPESGRYGGILTVGIGGNPVSLDIHQEDSSFTNAITAATYNSLLKPDPFGWPEFKPVPDLAASWQVSADGKVYTFHLAKGVKFHDGTALTAEDVKFSLDRIRNPQRGMSRSPRQQQLANVTSIDTPDDSTVKITLRNPQASFITVIATVYFAIMPRRVVSEKNNDMRNTVVGTGPFKFKSYAMGVGWDLEKNQNYFVRGRPYLDGVKGYVILDSFTRFAALRTKNILWWAPFPYMTVSQTKIIQETLSDKIAVQLESHPAWYGAMFNLTSPPWSDVRLRQAVSLTFDRKKMLVVGLEGAGVAGMSAQPPGEWSLPEEEMMKVPGYAKPDIDGARKLLAEAGFAAGLKAETLVRAVKPQQDMAVLLKDAVAAIGIDLDLKVVETAIYQDALSRKAYGIATGGVGTALTDPDMPLGDNYLSGSGRNWTGYNNPNFDQLFARQSETLDTAERRKIVWDMQRILLKDVPIAIAYWVKVPYAWWKEVRGYVPPVGFNNAFGYQDIWLAR